MSTVPSQSTSSRTSSGNLQFPWLNATSQLPEEVIAEILHLLPVEPLLRFRRVSKIWCSLIDSPSFVKKHLKRAIECNTDSGLIISGHNSQLCLAELDPLNDDTTAIEVDDHLVCGAKFVGSCNGLVCWLKNETDVLLWNPSTRKSKKLPSAPAEFPRTFSMVESCLCGFGYDHQSDDYKVVRIAECYRGPSSVTMVIVYSLKSNSWKRIQNISRDIRFIAKLGMFASGALHWLAIKNPTDCTSTIVAFDLGVETYREVPIPKVGVIGTSLCHRDFNTVILFVVGERLCILDHYPGSCTDMWLMNGYGLENSWSKLGSVMKSGILKLTGFVRPVAFSKSCKKILLEADSNKLVWYDLESKKVENVNIHGIPPEFDSHAYTESLVQLTEDSKSDGMELLKSHDKKEKKKQQRKKNESSKFLSKGFKLVL